MPDAAMRPSIDAAVEGATDGAVVARLIDHAGGQVGTVYVKKGKDRLYKKITGYNNAARRRPWLVLVDLDKEEKCAVPLRNAWLPAPAPAPLLCFRIVVRAIEAWLMADAETLARYLSVRPSHVPGAPEGLDDPKGAMVALARRSRCRDVREDMVPREGSGRRVGPGYPRRLIEYAATKWRPDIAAGNADSLRRAINCLRRLAGQRTDSGSTQ